MITGSAFPRGLGHDVSGVIEATGEQATQVRIGDDVFGAVGHIEAGTFAKVLVTKATLVCPKPPVLSLKEAATLPVVSSTAWSAPIEKAPLRAGQRVFIAGRLGGVRRLAVLITRMHAATVTGSCSAPRRDEALALGVQEVFDDRASDAATHRNRFDVVLDAYGSLAPRARTAILKPLGIVLDRVRAPLKMIWSLFSSRYHTLMSQMTPHIITGITKAVEAGQIRPLIARTVPLAQVIEDLIQLERTRLSLGKVVVAPMGS